MNNKYDAAVKMLSIDLFELALDYYELDRKERSNEVLFSDQFPNGQYVVVRNKNIYIWNTG